MPFRLPKPDIKLPRFYYIATLAILGGILVFLVPPYQSPDEQTHLYRAYQLSEGTLIAKRLSYGAGDLLPSSLSRSFNDYSYLLFQPDKKLDGAKHVRSLSQGLKRNELIETRFENTAPYPPLAYLPQIIGISVGKAFSVNAVVLLYLARLFNLFAWILILWFCMKRLPHVAMALFAFSLLPIVLFQSASASADVMTAGVAIVFSLETLRMATKKERVSKNEALSLIAIGCVLALCKLPYVILVLLVLAIPAKRFVTKKIAWQFWLTATLIPIAISLLWNFISAKSFVNLRDIADASAQVSFILHYPAKLIGTLSNTYITLPSDGLYLQMIGQLGWLDTKLTFWSMLFAFSAVFLATIGVIYTKDFSSPTKALRITAIILAGLTVGAISLALYLTWNAPGAPVIEGLQGRYYIPIIGTIIIGFMGVLGLKADQSRHVSLIVYVLLALVVIATLTAITFRYYSL